MTVHRERYHLVLVPVAGFKGEPVARLRAMLKLCLRCFGLKAVEVRPIGTERPTAEQEIDA